MRNIGNYFTCRNIPFSATKMIEASTHCKKQEFVHLLTNRKSFLRMLPNAFECYIHHEIHDDMTRLLLLLLLLLRHKTVSTTNRYIKDGNKT